MPINFGYELLKIKWFVKHNSSETCWGQNARKLQYCVIIFSRNQKRFFAQNIPLQKRQIVITFKHAMSSIDKQ